MLVADVMTPVEDIDAIVVAPYLNNNFPPLSSIVKFVVKSLGVDAAVPVVFWFNVGNEVNDAADPLGAKTSVPITKPRFVLAPAAVVAPVPPLATATVPVTLAALPDVFTLIVLGRLRVTEPAPLVTVTWLAVPVRLAFSHRFVGCIPKNSLPVARRLSRNIM